MNYLHELVFFCVFFTLVTARNNTIFVNHTESHFERIINGYRPEEFIFAKHIVSLRYGNEHNIYGSNHICGGSILSERLIVTAAHCVVSEKTREIADADYLVVVVGSTDRFRKTSRDQILRVRKIIPYPEFDFNTSLGDIALLHLRSKIIEDDFNIKKIDIIDRKPEAGLKCVFLGWGAVVFNGPGADELVYLNLTLLSGRFCSMLVENVTGLVCSGTLFDPYIYGGNGDSGGPLICDGSLVGVASFVTLVHTFFTSVYHFREWINENSKCNAEPQGSMEMLLTCLIWILMFWKTRARNFNLPSIQKLRLF